MLRWRLAAASDNNASYGISLEIKVIESKKTDRKKKA